MRWVRSGRSVAVAAAVQAAQLGDTGGTDHDGENRRADGRGQSSASASGRLVCIRMKVTSTLRVFCAMKTMSTTHSNAAEPMANQAAPVRV